HLMPAEGPGFIRARAGSQRRPTIRPTSGSARLRSVDGTQGNDYERRSYWQATMPALPDRSGRPLPDTADVVVIGGGYAGINAARELARRGTAVTLVETHTL